jgi:hypothetical protein
VHFLKADSPVHLRLLRVFEPLMVITGIVQPLVERDWECKWKLERKLGGADHQKTSFGGSVSQKSDSIRQRSK